MLEVNGNRGYHDSKHGTAHILPQYLGPNAGKEENVISSNINDTLANIEEEIVKAVSLPTNDLPQMETDDTLMDCNYTLYIPLVYNDGTVVPDNIIEGLVDSLVDYFGGATCLTGRGWGSNGVTRCKEPVLVVSCIAGYSDANVINVGIIANRVKVLLAQDTVLVTRAPLCADWIR